MFRVVAALQFAQHGIEVADLIVEIDIDMPFECIVNLVHELVGRQHLADVDSMFLGDLGGVVFLRLIGEIVGPVVQDAFRGHEEIHGEVLSAANREDGTDPVTAIDR